MKRLIVASLLALGALPIHVLANTWCSTNFPDAVFCDDFDRYCVNPPPAPQECPNGSTQDGDLFFSRYVPTGPCSSAIGLDTAHAVSPPWGARTNTQENSTLGLAKSTFASLVRARYGTQYSAMIGTDLNPLVFELVMQANRPRFDNSYLSLGTGYATAPTDYAWSSFCGCTSPDPRYPVICPQESPTAACPPASTWPHVDCIAVGFVSYLDPDPCHCSSSGDHSPSNDHLSFYDGFKWYRLRQGLFPNGNGDFLLRTHQNKIKITIKSTTFRVELNTPDTGEQSWCEMPREYMGSFSSMMIGYAVPCQLKTGNWECRGDPYDPVCGVGSPGGSVPYYDNMALYGGIPYDLPGACCFPNTSCTSGLNAGDCQFLGGTPSGPGTTCQTVACCPPLKPDHDLDTDVDVEDFGRFQSCLSSASFTPPPTLGCTCADLDLDTDVDANDFELFVDCMAGPAVPANPACAD